MLSGHARALQQARYQGTERGSGGFLVPLPERAR